MQLRTIPAPKLTGRQQPRSFGIHRGNDFSRGVRPATNADNNHANERRIRAPLPYSANLSIPISKPCKQAH